jgi:hypothetical protein
MTAMNPPCTTRGPLLQQRIHLYVNVDIGVADAITNALRCVAFLGVTRAQCNTYRSVGNPYIMRCKIATRFKHQSYALVHDIKRLNIFF